MSGRGPVSHGVKIVPAVSPKDGDEGGAPIGKTVMYGLKPKGQATRRVFDQLRDRERRYGVEANIRRMPW